ncbi:unnamed protein product (macronuclear) [Paramecium tetraurelia]|uniref:Uncharacterized protein n=1 Tax=Paramecium tetraurelia TaxID=5888 RepID=A0DBD9_PARTE|nr:uncharacterized protein GSPATT00015250001 [Paramecium tetraurelia]CAK80356.1 unnamed protein product [Paramecium tetraurelia]|eukprot:XP_001447753.1 hypothetical protein (macronuclear) [Paramecium tetraurelia strain d4-2]
MRKKVYTQAYFLIQNNQNYSHSFWSKNEVCWIKYIDWSLCSSQILFQCIKIEISQWRNYFRLIG